MAKNWLMGEAARAIRANDKAAIIDIGKRFPLTATVLAQLNDAGIALCEALPSYVTPRKIEAVLKGDVAVDEDDDENEESVAPKKEEKPVKKEKPTKKAKKPIVDEDDEDEPATKKAKKPKKEDKPAKKAKKKPVEDEDDDDFDDFELDEDDE